MFFGTSYRVKRLQDLNLPGIDFGDGSLVSFVDVATSLGVVLDSSLTWKPQIDQVTKEVNRAMYSLCFIKSCTIQALRERLVEALVNPHRDCCSVH